MHAYRSKSHMCADLCMLHVLYICACVIYVRNVISVHVCVLCVCVCVCLYASVCMCYMCCVYHALMLSAQDGSNKTLGSQKSG